MNIFSCPASCLCRLISTSFGKRSGAAGTYFKANAVGHYITYTVPVAKAGAYRVLLGIQTKPNKGQFQLAINGLNIG